jgi:hypothetical protein
LEPKIIIRVIDRIAADPEIAARLDGLDENGVRAEILDLYALEVRGET